MLLVFGDRNVYFSWWGHYKNGFTHRNLNTAFVLCFSQLIHMFLLYHWFLVKDYVEPRLQQEVCSCLTAMAEVLTGDGGLYKELLRRLLPPLSFWNRFEAIKKESLLCIISRDTIVDMISYSCGEGLFCAHGSLCFELLFSLLSSSTGLQAFSVLFKIVCTAYSYAHHLHSSSACRVNEWMLIMWLASVTYR